ncbi:LacI family DNA-binding transcriptional regulator [Micromonospora sediminicola]
MTDVARLAGVSHMTVSRVLNGHPPSVNRPACRPGVPTPQQPGQCRGTAALIGGRGPGHPHSRGPYDQSGSVPPLGRLKIKLGLFQKCGTEVQSGRLGVVAAGQPGG